jgi:hypothetical protein
MVKFIVTPPEKIEQARQLYEGTSLPIRDIAAMLGLGVTTFVKRTRLWGWRPRNRYKAELDAAAAAGVDLAEIRKVAAPSIAVAEKETLIDRVRSAVEREIVAIEAVLTRVEGARLRSTDAERAARTLATLVKTLREVAALQRDEKPETQTGEAEADEFRDLEEFRTELAERLDRIRKSRDAE